MIEALLALVTPDPWPGCGTGWCLPSQGGALHISSTTWVSGTTGTPGVTGRPYLPVRGDFNADYNEIDINNYMLSRAWVLQQAEM